MAFKVIAGIKRQKRHKWHLLLWHAGKGCDDVTGGACDDRNKHGGSTATLMTYDNAGVFGAVEICCALHGMYCFFFCLFNVLQNIMKRYGEFAGAGMPFDAIVMTFDDVGKCGDAEII